MAREFSVGQWPQMVMEKNWFYVGCTFSVLVWSYILGHHPSVFSMMMDSYWNFFSYFKEFTMPFTLTFSGRRRSITSALQLFEANACSADLSNCWDISSKILLLAAILPWAFSVVLVLLLPSCSLCELPKFTSPFPGK